MRQKYVIEWPCVGPGAWEGFAVQYSLERAGLICSSFFAALAAVSVLGFGAGAASASTAPFLVQTQSSSGHWNAIFDGNGYVTDITLHDANLHNGAESGVAAGAFALKGDINHTGVIGNFTAFCLDIFDGMSGSSWSYSVTADPFQRKAGQSWRNPNEDLTVQQQNDILKLYNTGYDPNQLSTSSYSAGFQIALWEIVDETGSGYNANSGNFSVSGDSAATSEANALLAGLSAANAPNKYKLVFLQNQGWANNCNGSGAYCDCKWLPPGQNLVTVSAVPLPASGLLLLSAVAGFGFASRRRRACLLTPMS